MKNFALATLLVLGASVAQALPSSTELSCQEAADLVQAKGAVVFATSTYTYERVVSHAGFCDRDETTRPAWLPTRDSAQCFAGYNCVPRNQP